MNISTATQLVPPEKIERLMHLVRGEKVLLDADLATATISFALPELVRICWRWSQR